MSCHGSRQFANLYGKKAAALYTQAGDYQKTARFYYKKAEDTYYQVCMCSVRWCFQQKSVWLLCQIVSMVLLVSIEQALETPSCI